MVVVVEWVLGEGIDSWRVLVGRCYVVLDMSIVVCGRVTCLFLWVFL